MKDGIRLGKLFDIQIFVHWSWILIFLLLGFNLSAGFLSDQGLDLGPGVGLMLGILASLAFFGTILAHELAHSIVAIWRGIRVRAITLFAFGGVASIEREPDSPKTELLVALAGPLISVGLGLLFLVLGGGMSSSASLEAATSALAAESAFAPALIWLGSANLILGLFNLAPGFPLDGGRILRATLWALSHDFKQATRWASSMGQLLGWLLTGTGLLMIFGFQVPIFGAGLASGLWLAFIGWYLNNLASQSYQHAVITDRLQGVKAGDLMRSQTETIHASMTIHEVLSDHVLGSEETEFPVLEHGSLVGLVTLNELQEAPGKVWYTTRVREVMIPTGELALIEPGQPALEALEKLVRSDLHRLLVVQGGTLRGFIDRQDILRCLQTEACRARSSWQPERAI